MRRLATSLALVTLALTATATAAAPAMAASSTAASGTTSQASYYLALGDSLSVGIQPDAERGGVIEPTRQGYTYQLYDALRQQDPSLLMADLGCSGETTETLINGGLCSYPPGYEPRAGNRGLPVSDPTGSQLQAATAFLRAHRGHVSLITIDIGANDLNPCIFVSPPPTPTQIATCVAGVAPKVAANLATIMTALRAAGGSSVRIIGMRYYDPELAYWLIGNQALAHASVRLVWNYNHLLASVYEQAGAKVADVFTAFNTADFTDQVALPGIGTVPANVATICALTWECTPFHNEHANAQGYAVIAQAFLAADQP